MTKILITGGSGFIGTNLIELLLLDSNIKIVNIDINEPKIFSHISYWNKIDIRDKSLLKKAINEFNPNNIIHLAARTDLNGKSLIEYSTNTIGTENLLDILEEMDFTGKAIFTSSMYVCKPGYIPNDYNDYKPHTIYGESKVLTEKIIKSKSKKYTSSIIRPTSIWGPWFSEPYSDFFKIVLRKKYVHIGNLSCKKTYGYVENTVRQIIDILNSPHNVINNNTFYLGDWPEYSIEEWANEIAVTVPYKIKKLPFWFFKLLAFLGDLIKILGYKFPMTSFRLKNMTTNNIHDLEPIKKITKEQSFNRKVGVDKTVNWLKTQNEIK